MERKRGTLKSLKIHKVNWNTFSLHQRSKSETSVAAQTRRAEVLHPHPYNKKKAG